MSLSVFAILVVAVTTAYWVNPSAAQDPSCELTPRSHRRVCKGGTMSFECSTNGTSLLLFAPPIIDENQAFNFFVSDPVQLCNSIGNVAVACILFEDDDSTTFTATLTIYVPPGQSGDFTVFCRALNAQGNATERNTTCGIDVDSPMNVTVDDQIPKSVCLSCVMNQSSSCSELSAVNLTWFPLRYVEQYVILMNGIVYTTTQNSMSMILPNGTYTPTIFANNSCGNMRTDLISENNISVSVSVDHCQVMLIPPDMPPPDMPPSDMPPSDMPPSNLTPLTPLDPQPETCGLLCIILLIVLAVVCVVLFVVASITSAYAIYSKKMYKLLKMDTSGQELTKKDKPPIYIKIPCTCGKVYIGETKKRLRTRLKEHKDACIKNLTEKSAIAEQE